LFLLDCFCDGLYHKWMNFQIWEEKPRTLHEASNLAEKQEVYQNFLQSRYDTNQPSLVMFDLSAEIFPAPTQVSSHENSSSDAGTATAWIISDIPTGVSIPRKGQLDGSNAWSSGSPTLTTTSTTAPATTSWGSVYGSTRSRRTSW